MFRLLSSVFAVGFCSMSTAAIAAEVVEMRLGRHSGFTRVVFELDAPAGYSLEQNVLDDGSTELVVILDASADTQELLLGKSLIRGVQLTGMGRNSVARIRLGTGKLRVKEMILGNPPRIVLDVLAPARVAKTAEKAAPMSAPKSSTNQSNPSAATKPKVVAKPAMSLPTPRRSVADAPVASINRGAAPSPVRVAAVPAARPAAQPKVVAPAKPSPIVAQKRAVVAPGVPAKQVVAPARTLDAKPARTPPPPARKKSTTPPGTLPAAPAAVPQAKSLFTATNIGGGLALVALVGGGTFFMMRRRKESELFDVSEFDEDATAAVNPFAEIDEAPSFVDAPSPADETAEIPIANVVDEFDSAGDADIAVAKVSADSGPDDSLFDTSSTEALAAEDSDTHINMSDAPSAEDSGDTMEAYGDTTTVNSGEDAMPPIPGVGGDSSETMRMLREFEQRMANLESRLDEISEAKERLERQVAAQTEELRVQRAAIARTQRALRNLSRPDEESPTEPALRDPNA
jgi:hypothetical protein